MPNFVPISQTILKMWLFSIFRLLLWICCAHIWTTHKQYLVTFMVLQTLVGS